MQATGESKFEEGSSAPIYIGNLLIVDPDGGSSSSIAYLFKKQKYRVFEAADKGKALEVLKRRKIHVALIEAHLPGGSGLDLLREFRLVYPGIEAVVMSAGALEAEMARVEAFDFVSKPFEIAILEASVGAAMQRSRGGSRPLNEAKLIVLGRGGAGKTCLIKRLVKDSFDEHEKETRGIDIYPWEAELGDHVSARIRIWDFGGQEILHATHQFFLTEGSVYLLILSAREGDPTADAEYWLQLIRSFGGESHVIIALNKCSLHPFEVNRRFLKEKYPFIAGFVKTDCSTKIGLSDILELIVTEVEQLKIRQLIFPSDWFEVKERLSDMREQFLSWTRFQDICRDVGEIDEKAQRNLAWYLHILGIALNYVSDKRLSDMHVLNPRWVTDGIYSILRALKQRRGGPFLNTNELWNYSSARVDFGYIRQVEKLAGKLSKGACAVSRLVRRKLSKETVTLLTIYREYKQRQESGREPPLNLAELERWLIIDLDGIIRGPLLYSSELEFSVQLPQDLQDLLDAEEEQASRGVIDSDRNAVLNRLFLDAAFSEELKPLDTVLDPRNYPRHTYDFLLGLMERFQLCFKLPGDGRRYLIPELLDENQPDLRSLLSVSGLGFRFQYEVFPEGLIPRFIVQTHAWSERHPEWRWRTGVVLEWDECQAVVRADRQARRVDVRITGPETRRRQLLAVVRYRFEEQHLVLKGVVVEERVPLPDKPEATVSYRHLLKLEESGVEEYLPEGGDQPVRVSELLNGVESLENRKRKRRQAESDNLVSDRLVQDDRGPYAVLGRNMKTCRLLFLAANPYGTSHLAIDEECREIDRKIRLSKHRDVLDFITKWALRADDLLEYFNQYRPHIVHFSGHGSSTEEIILVGSDGKPAGVSKSAMQKLFTAVNHIRVVVLNACFSLAQAEAIAEIVPCTVGMKQSIGDKSAAVFAAAFYSGIGFGLSVSEAFQQGRTALMLANLPGADIVELLARTGVDPRQQYPLVGNT